MFPRLRGPLGLRINYLTLMRAINQLKLIIDSYRKTQRYLFGFLEDILGF